MGRAPGVWLPSSYALSTGLGSPLSPEVCLPGAGLLGEEQGCLTGLLGQHAGIPSCRLLSWRQSVPLSPFPPVSGRGEQGALAGPGISFQARTKADSESACMWECCSPRSGVSGAGAGRGEHACGLSSAGYTVNSATVPGGGVLYLAGQPRYNHTGQVIVYRMEGGDVRILQALRGEQVSHGRRAPSVLRAGPTQPPAVRSSGTQSLLGPRLGGLEGLSLAGVVPAPVWRLSGKITAPNPAQLSSSEVPQCVRSHRCISAHADA